MSRRLRIKSAEKHRPAPLYLQAVSARVSPRTLPSSVSELQRTLGNQRVTQLIQAKRLTSGGKILGLQLKLAVGAANNQYEQEADRVARQVMSMPDVKATSASASPAIPEEKDKGKTLQTKRAVASSVASPLAASITPYAQRQAESAEEEDKEAAVQAKRENTALQRQPEMEEEKEEAEPIQAKPAQRLADRFEAGEHIESRLNQSKGGGSPLPDSVRGFMEPRFGMDLSHVRAHTSSEAIQMNRDVGAKAFTHGSDIYYGAGQNPDNLELTAHELTHVVQQQARDDSSNLITPGNKPGDNIHQTGIRQLSRQGLLNGAQETAAINFNNARYDERSIRIIQIISGTGVDGLFGRLSAEAVAAFQNINGLGVDGKVGEDTLNAMVANRVMAGRHEHAIQLVIDFHNLNVTRDTLTVHFDPTLAVAGDTTFESGNLRVIRIGPTAFVSAPALRTVINAQLTTPAPAPAAIGPRPSHLTNAEESAAIQFNRRRFRDRRSILAIQGIVGTGLDGVIGRDTVERIAEFQNVNGLTIDGQIGDGETLPAMVNQLIGANNQNAAVRLIVDFFNLRDDGNLLDVHFDPAIADNAVTDFRPNEPVRVRIGPNGLAQPFPGIVHTIAHEYEHVRRLKEGIVSANTHEFLGEAIEILSEGMPEEDLETLPPGAPGFVAGFADDASRALVNWNSMSLADRTTFRNRFIAVRQRVRDRIAAGTPAQALLHAPLLAGFNSVVLPP